MYPKAERYAPAQRPRPTLQDDEARFLKERYVRGELTLPEYETELQALLASGDAHASPAGRPIRLQPALPRFRLTRRVALGAGAAVVALGLALAVGVAWPRPAGAPSAAPGTILVDETFDAETGARYLLGMDGGEYLIRRIDQAPEGLALAPLPGVYADVSITVDARLVRETAGRWVAAGCRHTQRPFSGYRVALQPDSGLVRLTRWDHNTSTTLDQQTTPEALAGSAKNTLSLTCAGSTIAGSVNGERVVAAQDSTYRRGAAWIGVPAPASPSAAEVRFDNLTVVQQ